MRSFFFLISGALLFTSCAALHPPSARAAHKIEREISQSTVFSKAFTGFTLLDPDSGETLVDINGDHYFTPASNMKILTLATCLMVLEDSVPGMQVIQAEQELVFRGTGDPTFLHPKFQQWHACWDTLVAHKSDSIRYLPRRFPASRFGSGWAWDDYNENYQQERSEMPIYGNSLEFTCLDSNSIEVNPPFFKESFFQNTTNPKPGTFRLEHENIWIFQPDKKEDHLVLPFKKVAFEFLMRDTLHREVENIFFTEHPYHLLYPTKTLFSTPIDTVLRFMMHHSDNFIAEQMLLVCAGQKFDYLEQDTMIQWMLDSVFNTLPQRPRWVDGSGLSRYNLISPQDVSQVLQRLWQTQSNERLLSFFPAGGVSGTIENWYQGKDGKPYVFAKTGSMSGVHCLSGYLVCHSGKVLVFSFMHNNFVGTNKPWKEEMQRALERIYSIY